MKSAAEYGRLWDQAKAAEAAARRRNEEARLAYERTQRQYSEAQWATEKANFDYSCAKSGHIPLKNGTWLSGKYAAEHPDEFKEEYAE